MLRLMWCVPSKSRLVLPSTLLRVYYEFWQGEKGSKDLLKRWLAWKGMFVEWIFKHTLGVNILVPRRLHGCKVMQHPKCLVKSCSRSVFFMHGMGFSRTGGTPLKTNMSLKRDYFNRKYIFQPLIFRGHVSFPGSTVFRGLTEQWPCWAVGGGNTCHQLQPG